MFGRQRLWIGTALVVVLVLIPTSLVGGSRQTTQVSTDADSAQQVALASNAASIEADMSGMSSEALSTLGAQAAQGDGCDDLDDHGEKIKCKSDRLMEEVCDTADLAAQDDLGLFAQSTKDELDNLCAYGTAAVAAADAAEFKSVGMRRNAGGGAGAVMEYVGDDPDNDGDDDGICKPKGKKDANVLASNDGHGDGKKPNDLYKEWCAEVIGDGIGDEDGFCEYQGKGQAKYLEPCVRVSGVDAIDGQEENFNEDKLIALEDALDAQTETLRTSNAALATAMEELRAQRAVSRELLAGNAGQCLDLMQTTWGGEGTRPHWLELSIELGVAIGMEGAYDMTDSASNLDVAGFNGSAAGVALAVAKAAAAGVYHARELTDDLITGERLDNAVQCLEYLGEQIQDIMNGVNEANAKIDYVVEHRRVHLQVVELKEKREFLVSATEAGKPSSQLGHEIVGSLTVRVSEKHPLSFVDVTITRTDLGSGLHLVVIDLPQSLKNAELFVFEVSHTVNYPVTIDGNEEWRSTVHSGFTLFDRSSQNNVGMGQ